MCRFIVGCLRLWVPEWRDVQILCELVLDEGIEEFVVEGLVPGLAGEHLSEVSALLAHDRLEADHGGALGAIAMCVDAAENPMTCVPWWVSISWFHAMRSSSSG